MTGSVITHYNQSLRTRTRATEKSVSTLAMNFTTVSAGSNSHQSDHETMGQQQELLRKEELAPDWVWEYGIMG
ncbi:MAG: hypothetical protein KTR27_13865 [Leptolyngbyaceae cyanobacterium MAG.088]|nr:hypothetical protein [Leptolyngbyaceae cyanobacterium MAG.088]